MKNKDVDVDALVLDAGEDDLVEEPEVVPPLPEEETGFVYPDRITALKIKLRVRHGHKKGEEVVLHSWDSIVVAIFCLCHTATCRGKLSEIVKNCGVNVAEVAFDATVEYSYASAQEKLNLSDRLASSLTTAFKNIVNIEFSHLDMARFGPSGCQSLAKLDHLECLIFQTCTGFNEKKIIKSIASLNLIELWIENSMELTDHGLSYIAENIPSRFTRLSIDGCVNVTVNGIVDFLNRMAKWSGTKLGICAVHTGLKPDQLPSILATAHISFDRQVECIDDSISPAWGYQPFTIRKGKHTLFLQMYGTIKLV